MVNFKRCKYLWLLKTSTNLGLYVKTQTICLANIFVHFYRFNWGLCVRRLSQRILKLLGNKDFLKEERERARKETQGFGSFSQGSSSSAINERLHDTSSKTYGRCKSDYGDHHHHEQYDDFTSLEKKLVSEDGNKRMAKQHVFGNENFKLLKQENDSNSGIRRRHRRTIALDQENQLTTISLLSVK